MKRFMKIAFVGILCVALLCACQSKKNDPLGENVISANAGNGMTQDIYGNNVQTQPSEGTSNYDSGSYNWDDSYNSGAYNPGSEENTGFGDDYAYSQPAVTEPQFLTSEYAGATPVVIDPVDKPTPTPVPPLNFTYQLYESPSMHISFEGPAGWMVNDTGYDSYVITNPDRSMDYAATVTVSTARVASSYTTADLKNEVKASLNAIKDSGLSSFSPSQTAERTLLDKTGVYANYTAKNSDGAEIAGRIIMVEIDKTLYTIHVTYPRAYRDTYVDKVYNKVRQTMKITQ